MLQEIHHVATDDSCFGKTDEKTTDICQAYEILADVAKLNKSLDDNEKTKLAHEVVMVMQCLCRSTFSLYIWIIQIVFNNQT